MGAPVNIRTRQRAGAPTPPAERRAESPLDRAKGHELKWSAAAGIFSAVRGFDDAQFVYVVSEGIDGPVKIGRAKDPVKRLRQMQTGNSRRLRIEYVLLGNKIVEGLLHELWEPSAIRSVDRQNKFDTRPGTEWFEPEVRERLFPILQTALEAQLEHLEEFGANFDSDVTDDIVFKAHLLHDHKIHCRDEVRLMAEGAGTIVRRPSVVRRYFGPRYDFSC